jgi:hypothetical protein
MQQFVNAGGLAQDLDFGLVEFLTFKIDSDWFSDTFEFVEKIKNFKPTLAWLKPTYAGYKSHYGVI